MPRRHDVLRPLNRGGFTPGEIARGTTIKLSPPGISYATDDRAEIQTAGDARNVVAMIDHTRVAT
jgi:hypothetical protein